jgi:hypothetical protein
MTDIPLSMIKDPRFDLLKRNIIADIQASEDARIFAVMDKIAQEGFAHLSGPPEAEGWDDWPLAGAHG